MLEVDNMTIIPMRDLKNTVEIEKRCAEENGPVFVTKNGYGKLVVMDIDYYEKLMSKIYEAKNINEGLADLEHGKLVDGETVKARLTEKYGL
jgi:prevent-host-death family protein